MNSISIIGAGIGGLTLGNILKQQNIDFTLYESAPEIKPVGAGIMMAVNAMQVFDKLGLKEKIEYAGNKIHVISITDENFRLISKTDVLALEKKYNSCNVAIHRAELQRILAGNIGLDQIKLNHSLHRIQKKENYILSFGNGNEIESKIVFGADGIKSGIRKQVLKTGKIRKAGQICWRGWTDFSLPEQYDHEAFEMWEKGKRFGFVKMSASKVYWYAVVNENRYQRYHTVAEHFSSFHLLIRQLIETTLPEHIILNDLTDLSPIPKWYTENLCLIGDAAHATTPNLGQGACQAIEDAYIIGKLLEQTKDFTQVFEKFQKIRRQKVDQVVSTSWHIGKFSQWERAIFLRNFLMKSVPDHINQKLAEKIIQLEM
ncbi:FAD-dependent monooxygenase [Chryseobacterium sp. SSA4.19]|uniref:FAD-dependent monooxygenase n=1 Tax=Chryseobacterium sp. SSA4.19 TaxID=2919915 RepID=UPI001F4E03B1|nr:FAD-dependent monooxygenase [Chryseobacterium sp. SSA4.19]MCJ8153444.1 FAD-dependent monooxygenase [Chryseobacterium sp. SSA4.19]